MSVDVETNKFRPLELNERNVKATFKNVWRMKIISKRAFIIHKFWIRNTVGKPLNL